jgi:hypothetical protein
MNAKRRSNINRLALRLFLVTIIVALCGISSHANYHSHSFMHLPLKDNFGAKVGIDLGAVPLDRALNIAAQAHVHEQVKKEAHSREAFELRVVFPTDLDERTREAYLDHLLKQWGSHFNIHKIKIIPIYFDISAAEEDIKRFRVNLTNAMLQIKNETLSSEQQKLIKNALEEFDQVEKDLSIWKKSIPLWERFASVREKSANFWKQRFTSPDQVNAIGKLIGYGKGGITAATWFGSMGGYSALSSMTLGLTALFTGSAEMLPSMENTAEFLSANKENIGKIVGGGVLGALAAANAYAFVKWADSWSNWKNNHKLIGSERWGLSKKFKLVAKYNNSPMIKTFVTGIAMSTIVSASFRTISDLFMGNPLSIFTPEFIMGQGVLAVGSAFFESLTDVGSKTLERKGYVNGHTKQYILWLPGIADTLMWLFFRTGNMPLTYLFGAVSWSMRAGIYGLAKVLPDRSNHIVSIPGFIPATHKESAKSLVNVKGHLNKEAFETHMQERALTGTNSKEGFFKLHQQAESIKIAIEKSQRSTRVRHYLLKKRVRNANLSLQELYVKTDIQRQEFTEYIFNQRTKLSQMSSKAYYSIKCKFSFKKK